jgi:hypothetical protein
LIIAVCTFIDVFALVMPWGGRWAKAIVALTAPERSCLVHARQSQTAAIIRSTLIDISTKLVPILCVAFDAASAVKGPH